MNRASDETRQDGTRGQTVSWSAVPASVRVCVQGGGQRGASALLVTRASFIMSDDINHKADRTKWRNRYGPDLSMVISPKTVEK